MSDDAQRLPKSKAPCTPKKGGKSRPGAERQPDKPCAAYAAALGEELPSLPMELGVEDRVRQRLLARRLEQALAAQEFYKLRTPSS